MSRSIQSILTFLFMHFCALQINAQTTTWTGTTSNDWNLASNWDNGIPTATYDVVIPAVFLHPQINSVVSIQSLMLQAGSSLDILGGSLTVNTTSSNQGTITVSGGTWTNQGNIQNNGTIQIGVNRALSLAANLINNGTLSAANPSLFELNSTGVQSISGTGTSNLSQLNKNQGQLNLEQDISIGQDFIIPALLTLNLGLGHNISLNQNLSVLGTFNAANAILTLEGANNQTLQGNGAINLGQFILDKTTGIISLDASIGLIQDFIVPVGVEVVLSANRTLSLANQIIINGTFTDTATNTTVNFNGTSAISLAAGSLADFQNLQVSKTGAGSLMIAQNITVSGNLLINSGTFNIGTGFTVNLAGNFTNNGNNFIANTGSIVNLIGATDQNLSGTGQVRFDQLQVSKTAGTLFIDRNPIEVMQDFTIPAGVSFRVSPGQNFDIFNDFINEGTVLPNDGGVRFRGSGDAELRGNGTMTFRDLMSRKTDGGSLSIKVPVNVASWLIIDANAQLSLEADITVGAAGSIARLQNNGTFTDNGFKVIVEGGGDYNIQGNTQTTFTNIEIIKTNGRLVFQQGATLLENFLLPPNVTLTINPDIELRLAKDLTVNGTIDPNQANSRIWFVGNTDAQINGNTNPITFRSISVAKTAGNTLTLNANTQYAYQIYVEAGNTLRLNDGFTTLVQNDSDTFIFGTLSLGNNTAMNYDNGNTELRIENTGRLINDINSINTIQARLRIRNGGGVCTINNGSRLTATGTFLNVEWNGATLNIHPNATLLIYRDLQLNNAAIFNMDNTAFIEFGGNQNSDIEGGGNLLTIPNLRINKTGDQVDLRRDVRITGYLDLVSRHINSSDNDILIFAEGATHSGGSQASYINGPARKIGNTSFIFPLGKNNRFGKLGIAINTAGANTDYFEVEYFGTFFGNTSITAPITDISDRDFWQLERSGTSQVTVVLYWQDLISGGLGPIGITNSDLRVAQWNDVSLSWENRGNTTATITDFIESNPNQDSFTDQKFWTLGYSSGDNPNWGASTWIGSISSDWDNPNNWEPAIVPDETITAVIIGDRLPEGKFNPIKNTGGGIAKAKALLIPRGIFPTSLPTTEKALLTISNNTTLQVGDGTAGSGLIECYGDILNQGTLSNTSDFYIYEDALITQQDSISIGGRLLMYDTGILNTGSTSFLNIAAQLLTYDGARINHQGSLQIGLNMELRNNSTIHNLNNGEITVGQRTYLRDASSFINDNLLNTNRQLDIYNDAVLTNNALINTGIQAGQAGTFEMRNNARLNNGLGASIIINPGSSFFLRNSTTINNEGTLTSGRQFEIRDAGVTVTNNGLIRWRQDFMNNGTFAGTGTMEVYENANNTRIYGTSTPFITHNLIINRTGGRVIQERSCTWTNSVTVPANVTYEIQAGLYDTEIQGNFTINGTFDLQGDAAIAISEDFINNGTVLAGTESTVTMQGNTNGAIQSTSPLTLHHLIHQKTAGNTQIAPSITLNGDLSNLSGELVFVAGAHADLKGNLINNDILGFHTSNSFTFSGNTDSNVSGTGEVIFTQLNINKSTGNRVMLSRAVEVSQSLTLTNGIINTSTANLLILQENTTSTEGSHQSYINGPLRKYVNGSNFVFPTGKNGRWARIALTDLANTSSGDYFTANYFPFKFGDPTAIDLDRASGLEHWTLDRSTAATTEAKVTLYWEDGNFSDIVDVSIVDLRVAHYSNTPSAGWYDRGGVVTGTVAQGNITTDSRQNDFSPWTFGSTNGVNPLPIHLLEFKAQSNDNQTVMLKWSTASEQNVSHFEIERSQDGQNFQRILAQDAAGNSNTRKDYAALDNQPLAGMNYYRLKSVDNDGSTSYSLVETVRFEEGVFEITNLYPNPVLRESTLEMTLPQNTLYQIVVYDLRGKQVYLSETQSASAPFVQKRLDFGHLKAGTYILKVIGHQRSLTHRLVKID